METKTEFVNTIQYKSIFFINYKRKKRVVFITLILQASYIMTKTVFKASCVPVAILMTLLQLRVNLICSYRARFKGFEKFC